MSERLRYQYGDKTIPELVQLQEGGHLNLEPGFQRQSVWSLTDRRKLVQSILQGYPVPSIFLYRREEGGWPVYDVLDGKQRLETIFMYMKTTGFRRKGFPVRFQFEDDDKPYWYEWTDLKKYHLTAPFLSYRIQTVEVSGDLSDIVDLFVRINSAGKALTSAERRNARFYTSPFLKEAERLARRGQQLFVEYLMSVQQSTDALAQRKRRGEIVRGVLGGLFERKDDRRIFSPEQRRLLWNSDERKACSECGERLDWTNFQVDHIRPYSKGGRTELRNAALICSFCNPSKGAGRRRRKPRKRV